MTNLKACNKLIYETLSREHQTFINELSKIYSFTFQELKILMEQAIDLKSWNEIDIKDLWNSFEEKFSKLDKKNGKKKILSLINKTYFEIKNSPINYKKNIPQKIITPTIKHNYISNTSTIFGFCPVSSKETLCCNLRTLDAVHGCEFACNYCALKSTYTENQVTFHENLDYLLDNIKLNQNKKYHVGTGQSSDALSWGNKDDLLFKLFCFARKNKNIFLELKTKSNNISYLFERKIPENVFPSFSLNPQIIIENEELLTASLDQRLIAAKELAQKGIKVAFHFHPIIIYEGWKKDYGDLVKTLISDFSPSDILFISLGTLHFPKPVLKKIRFSSSNSKIYKIPFTQNPEKKYTYPYDKKMEMFSFVYEAFKPWHSKVFFYLCMEIREFWNDLFGYSFKNNEEFEEKLLEEISKKIYK